MATRCTCRAGAGRGWTWSTRKRGTVAVGQRPWNMALTPDGARLYVAYGRSETASVIDTQVPKRIADVPVGELPWGVASR